MTVVLGPCRMNFEEGIVMKNAKKSKNFAFPRNGWIRLLALPARLFAFIVIFYALLLLPCGCSSYAQMGETEAEGRRRHIRNARVNRQQMMEDIDSVMLYDKPSKLSKKRIP